MATAKDNLSSPEDWDADWEKNKAALLARLKRTEGQIRGIQAMIETDAECEKVAQQMAAARKALDRAFYNMLSCVMERELACQHLDAATARERLNYATQLLSKYG
ncbi:DNA-binding FrmR family transcriptional regulator [Methylohalomonas lacus]|uniref:DNA-binding FrmR family transcriptional regulator n=1 Tax=Methylohalomonas lacus TaxID=398773 RepID=A0AAE3HMT0_9GAMM|nr:metal-sensing transcriptional repressor [Methylohalomonas lacus]MCS3904004.1 DNA-binding FrmR family transcriptional regulator [Methylohalomonas lacus]